MEAPTLKDLEDFTMEAYIDLLRYLRGIYRIIPVCNISQKDDQYLILRHDVDVSLPAALRIAQIERDLRIRSTYFVMLSSPFYNVFEGRNADILKRICDLGHEVGLHYYPAQYRSYRRDLGSSFKIQVQILEHLSGKKVRSIARHGTWDRDPFAAVRGYVNANHPHLRGDLLLHDSCRAWSPLVGLLRLLEDPPRRVQLLTHPENWQDEKIDRETLLERHIQNMERKVATVREEMRRLWLTDPLVTEYDRTKMNFMQCNPERHKLRSTPVERKWQRFSYYTDLFRWLIINTSSGWWVHRRLHSLRSRVTLRVLNVPR